jgi:hypothetical protein
MSLQDRRCARVRKKYKTILLDILDFIDRILALNEFYYEDLKKDVTRLQGKMYYKNEQERQYARILERLEARGEKDSIPAKMIRGEDL